MLHRRGRAGRRPGARRASLLLRRARAVAAAHRRHRRRCGPRDEVADLVDAGRLPDPIPVAGGQLGAGGGRPGPGPRRRRSAPTGSSPLLRAGRARRGSGRERLSIDGRPGRPRTARCGWSRCRPGRRRTGSTGRGRPVAPDVAAQQRVLRTALLVAFPLLVAVLARDRLAGDRRAPCGRSRRCARGAARDHRQRPGRAAAGAAGRRRDPAGWP